jgi:hypothetical protein
MTHRPNRVFEMSVMSVAALNTSFKEEPEHE